VVEMISEEEYEKFLKQCSGQCTKLKIFGESLASKSEETLSDEGSSDFIEFKRKLKENIVVLRWEKSWGRIDIKPEFFRENYKLATEFFPHFVRDIRNYSRRDFIIRTGKYELEIPGNSLSGGAYIWDRMSGYFKEYELSPLAGEAFVKIVARSRIKRLCDVILQLITT